MYLSKLTSWVTPFTPPSQSGTWVWFDSDFSFAKHVQNVCKSCFIQLRDFRNIRQFLTQDAAVSVANAFVSSRLDYCNSLFRSLSKFNLHRLQSIQNSAARIVTNSSRFTRITPVLRKLHWLPVQFGSEFKLATLVYKFIHTGFPKYFAPYLSTYNNTYNTRPSQGVANFLSAKFTSSLNNLVSVSLLMLLLSGIHSLKTFMHHPILPHLEKSSKPISTQRLILSSSFSLLASLWWRPFSVPGLCILHIAIVLLRLRVHYSEEIKHYKSQIRIRIHSCVVYSLQIQDLKFGSNISVSSIVSVVRLKYCHSTLLQFLKQW